MVSDTVMIIISVIVIGSVAAASIYYAMAVKKAVDAKLKEMQEV